MKRDDKHGSSKSDKGNQIWTALGADEIAKLDSHGFNGEDGNAIDDGTETEQNPEPSLALGIHEKGNTNRDWVYLHMITDHNRQLLIENIRDVVHKARASP